MRALAGCAAGAAFCMALLPIDADAAESAAGIYLLGSRSSLMGMMPPPGLYANNFKYYYTGEIGGSAAVGKTLDSLGNIAAFADLRVRGQAYVDVTSLLWVTPYEILGGRLGFAGGASMGWKRTVGRLDAFADLTLPDGTHIARGTSHRVAGEEFSYGDPMVQAMLGWNHGHWHWNLIAQLYLPFGDYTKGDLVNVGIHHWSSDLSVAVTYLDPHNGLEVSFSPGFTFNWENEATLYRTGTEFHGEFAVLKHFNEKWALGVAGYHYHQLTGDSGPGAKIGSFEGRTFGIGPILTHNFMVDGKPVTTSLRWLREYYSVNRTKGDTVLLNVGIPIHVSAHQ